MGGRGSASGVTGGGASPEVTYYPSTTEWANLTTDAKEGYLTAMPKGTIMVVKTYDDDNISTSLNSLQKQANGDWKVIGGPVKSKKYFKKKKVPASRLAKYGVKMMGLYTASGENMA